MSRDTIRLPRDAYWLLQTLRAAGHSAYVVGGCVRDSLLGRMPGDWDICTSARPAEMRELFHDQRLILTGEKHGTVAVILHGKPYEMTTYRLDGNYRDHRHPDSVRFVDDLAADLARRDFTINAMAYAPGEVIDLYGGRQDLAAGIVRCVGTPPTALPRTPCASCARCGFRPSSALRWIPPPPKPHWQRGTRCTPSALSAFTPSWTACCWPPVPGRRWRSTAKFWAVLCPRCCPASAARNPESGIATMYGSILPPPCRRWICAGRTPAACGCSAGPPSCMTLPNRFAAVSGRTAPPTSKGTTSGAHSWRGSFCAA